jgi:cation transport regulator ChaB
MPSITAQGISLGTGMASTIATGAADISRNGLTWANAGSTALGLGMDIASTLYKPAKVTKVGKTMARLAPWIGRVFKGIGAINAYAVLQKGMNEGWDTVSTSEWQQLLGGI